MPNQSFDPAAHMNATSSHTQPAPELPRSGEERDAQPFTAPEALRCSPEAPGSRPHPSGTRHRLRRLSPDGPRAHTGPGLTRAATRRSEHAGAVPCRTGPGRAGPDRMALSPPAAARRPGRTARHTPTARARRARLLRAAQEMPAASVTMGAGHAAAAPVLPPRHGRAAAEPAGSPSLSGKRLLTSRRLLARAEPGPCSLPDPPQGAAWEESRVGTHVRAQYRNLHHSPESESAASTSFTVHGSTACPETLNPSQRQRPRTGHSTAGLKDSTRGRPRRAASTSPRRHRPPRRGPSAPRTIRPLRGGSVLQSVPTADLSAFHQHWWKTRDCPRRHAAAMTPQ
ncbi:unnamed protein product [Coccothraustes coccothraustes]